ncbi:MAG: hypothetical protein LC689_19145, partial [Myxococcales bacterium]|nr:hypothetical protein [Myxococcales bacterium]
MHPVAGVSRGFALVAVSVFSVSAHADPTPGQNVNMVSGRQLPGGDPFLQRQNEPSIGMSSRNPLHLLAGANDYRTVDLPMPDQLENDENTGDAWLGLFKSFNGGQTWQSTLVPGYAQDGSADGLASPLKGFTTASDPVVRSGTNGLFYYAGIAFNRATSQGVVFVSRYVDLNNRENGNAAPGTVFDDTTDPIRYGGTRVVAAAQPGEFLDKPWIAVDVPRSGASTCTLTVKQAGAPVTQGPFAAGNVYLAYTKFFQNASGATIGSQLMFSRSTDCGATWSAPKAFIALDELTLGTSNLHQGIALKVDPEAGFVYAIWRRFKSTTRPDSILGAVSIDGGRNFTPGIPLVTLPAYDFANPGAATFFDQGTSGATFRTNAFPAIAVDDSGFPGIPGRIYLAWSQRTAPYGDARIQLVNLPGSILVTSAGLSLKQFIVSGAPLFDDTADSFSRGHQLMPQLAFTQGKLLAAFYDLRLDHTSSTFARLSAPDAQGRLFLETLNLAGELLVDPTKVFTPFLSDANPPLNLRRHTIDVVVAEANPGTSPVFTTARVSRYKSGVLAGDATGTIRQLQVDPPGLPLFKGGDVPFFGDYIDIAGQTFVPKGTGWSFNSSPASAPVHIVTWTSNQDVRPPLNNDWHDYTPVGTDANRPSFFDPTHPGGAPDCRVGQEGMRNQNIYSSRITEGLVLASPQNTKPLSATVQRAFSLVVQNLTSVKKSFRLTIVNQPPNGGFASFVQAPNTTPLPSPLPAATKTLDVSVAARAGIARSVFVISGSPQAPTASVTVRADEITAPGPTGSIVAGGLSSFIVFNADGTVPPLVNPDSSPADIGTLEIYDPDVANPDVANPNEGKSAVPNPDVANPDVANPDVANPDVANPDVANPDVANVNVTNPDVANPDVANSTISDATYAITNDGNTSASYTVKLVGNAPPGAKLQLIVNKSYRTPVAVQCNLKEETQNTLQSNVLHPNILDPASPDVANPDVANPDVANSTLSLQPGERALITLRGNVTLTTMQQIVTTVTPVVVAQAANTGSTKPTVATAPLTIIGTLTGAAIGRTYNATLQATGGLPPYSWSLATPLPHGLGMSAGGAISGIVADDVTPSAHSFTAVVTDRRGVSKSRLMTIAVVQPLVYFLRQDDNGNSVVGTIDTSGEVADAFAIGSGFDALTFADVNVGYGPGLYYYLRHDDTGFSTFGSLDLNGAATDRFGVGNSFDALTFVAADLGYGPNLFYYLRHDDTGFSTFGTISTSGAITDRFGVGVGFNALAFAHNDLGYGPNLFYYVRTDATFFSTFGTIAVSGDINDRFGLGYSYTALAYTDVDLGYGTNLFYYARNNDAVYE